MQLQMLLIMLSVVVYNPIVFYQYFTTLTGNTNYVGITDLSAIVLFAAERLTHTHTRLGIKFINYVNCY
jgi:hypothetical protein